MSADPAAPEPVAAPVAVATPEEVTVTVSAPVEAPPVVVEAAAIAVTDVKTASEAAALSPPPPAPSVIVRCRVDTRAGGATGLQTADLSADGRETYLVLGTYSEALGKFLEHGSNVLVTFTKETK